MPIYLDHNATTPADPAVITAVATAMVESWGNPSTLYGTGKNARRILDASREKIAALIGADDPSGIIFTSGGTEGNNMVLFGARCSHPSHRMHLITSMAEHKAVLRPCRRLEEQGLDVTYLPVDNLGRVDPGAIRRALTPETRLVSIMFANNEVGTINPIAEISEICRTSGALFHTDAVQAVGKVPLDVKALGVDFLTLSAHKFHGPRGIGAVWIRQPGSGLAPLLHGGSQERGLRAGTENVAGAHGLGVAAEIAFQRIAADAPQMRILRDRLWERIRIEISGARVHGDMENGLPNVLNVSIPGWEAEELVFALEREGIEAGHGSACTTGQTTPSHVLLAMGIPPKEARASLRFSIGRGNTIEEIDKTADVLGRLSFR